MRLSRGLGAAAGVAIALLTPALWAAGGGQAAGEHHGIDLKTLVFQLVNFGLLMFILVKFAGGAINKALKVRHDQLKADLASAAEARAAAETRLKEQERRMANLENEIAALRSSMHKEAEAEKARLIAAAEEKGRRIKEETQFLLEQQIKEARTSLRREAADTALAVASDILRRQVDGHDQHRLIEAFVDEVGGESSPAIPVAGSAAGARSS